MRNQQNFPCTNAREKIKLLDRCQLFGIPLNTIGKHIGIKNYEWHSIIAINK